MGTVSSICSCCTFFYVFPYCASFSYLCSSCSSENCCFNSSNSFTISSILCLSFCLCMFLLLRCRLFASISKAAFSTIGSTLNLQLCSTFMLSTIFLLPLSRASILLSTATDDGSLLDVASRCFYNHSIAMLTGSSGLEKM